MEIAIKGHGSGEINEGVYAEAFAFWEAFLLFNDVVTRGCDDNDHVAVEAHAPELENLGAVFLFAYLEVATDSHVIIYMHIMACHMSDIVREWGGLMKWCSQGAEARHQIIIVLLGTAQQGGGGVSQVMLTRVHKLMKMRAQPSCRQRVRHTGKHVTGTGHVSKAKREVHDHTQNKLKTKYPGRNFIESCAVKRARGE
jgi:hypothetical protein